MDHATTMRRLYSLLSAGDIDGFAALISDDFVDHEELPGLAPTKEGVTTFFRMYRAAFPDLRMVPEDVIVSGDKVVARVRVTGTHKGAFMDLPPTGRRVEVQLMTSFASAPTGVGASTGASSTSSGCCNSSVRFRQALQPSRRGRSRETPQGFPSRSMSFYGGTPRMCHCRRASAA